MNPYTNEYAENSSERLLYSKNEFQIVRKVGYSVELSDTLSEGWKLVQRNFLFLILFSILSFIMLFIVAILLYM